MDQGNHMSADELRALAKRLDALNAFKEANKEDIKVFVEIEFSGIVYDSVGDKLGEVSFDELGNFVFYANGLPE